MINRRAFSCVMVHSETYLLCLAVDFLKLRMIEKCVKSRKEF